MHPSRIMYYKHKRINTDNDHIHSYCQVISKTGNKRSTNDN